MMSQNPVLDNKPIDQWKVTELREELRRRKLVTKGVKEELVKRLDEAIQKEMNSENGVDLGNSVNYSATIKNSKEEDTEPESKNNTRATDDVNETDKDVVMVDRNNPVVSTNLGSEDQNENADEALGASRTIEQKEVITNDLVDDMSGERNVIIQSDIDPENSTKCEDLREDNAAVHSERSIQVSEISQDLGLQVKYESFSTDSASINEKNYVKDNLNDHNFPLELEVVKQEVQPSSSSTGGEDFCMVVDEQEVRANCVADEQQDVDTKFVSDELEVSQKILSDDQEANYNGYNEQIIVQNHITCQQPLIVKHASLEVAETEAALIVNCQVKEDCVDAGSLEKLNLDRSSGDESVDDDLLENKHLEADTKFPEPVVKIEDNAYGIIEKKFVVDISDKFSHEIKDIAAEDVKPTVPTEKRKLEEAEVAGNNDAPKRQRRWNTDAIKIPQVSEQKMLHVSTPTPKVNKTVQPELRRSFSRTNSTVSEEPFKERIVPTPKRPATTSLRIDNFLRPFTLKAVQELLAKTGKVCDFWMDHIKTHCYVTYSSAEEAAGTRNAVYNLQWPPNGGRLLVAEFVDPQEVKIRMEAPLPPQSPVTPVGPVAAPGKLLPAPPLQQKAQPPSRPQNQPRQQPILPPPPPQLAQLPPPPPQPVPNPNNNIVPRERLPPPPKKPDPPVLTLDDLFKKTKVTPRIYYLPLSEEQVAAKSVAPGKGGAARPH